MSIQKFFVFLERKERVVIGRLNFKHMKLKFTLLFLTLAFYSQAQNWNLLHKSSALHREVDARYGATIDIFQGEAVVGTFSEDTDENGENPLGEAGAVYVLNFDNQSGEWVASQKLVAQPRQVSEFFGVDAALDGNFMIVGAKSSDFDEEGSNFVDDAGAAYIFEKINGEWVQIQKIVASDRAEFNYFGSIVDISGDYAVVIASNNGTDENNQNQLDNAGAGYIFHREANGTWVQSQKIVASDRGIMDFFGNAVSMDGSNLIVGAYFEDHDFMGNNMMAESGSAYLFQMNAQGVWEENTKITALDRAANDWFGNSVAISGDNIVIAARQEDEDATGGNTMTNAGSVYVFHNDGNNNWLQTQKLTSSDRTANDLFGYAVDIFEDKIIIGARSEDEDENGQNTLSKAGSAYLFANTEGVWTQEQKVVASDRHTNDFFGSSVALSSTLMMTGARGNDTDQNDENPLSNSGAVYVFTTCLPNNTDFPMEICYGDSVLIGENYQSVTGDYIVATMDSLGCVSTITYQLTVTQSTTTQVEMEACEGETITVEGQEYTTSTSFLVLGAGMCPDSTFYNLVFHPTENQTIDYNICAGDSVLVLGQYYNDDTTITVEDTTAFGCPSTTIHQVNLIVVEDQTVTDELCEGETIVIGGETISTEGTYEEVVDNSGCEYTLTHNVTVLPLPQVDLGVDQTVCDTLDFFLDAGAGFDTYLWSDNSTLQTLEITETGVYSVTVTQGGCSNSDEVEITVTTCTGIEELTVDELEVYPNPTAGTIYFDNINRQFERFVIYNDKGQIIRDSNLNNTSSIDVKELASGMYMVEFIGKEITRKARFIKK